MKMEKKNSLKVQIVELKKTRFDDRAAILCRVFVRLARDRAYYKLLISITIRVPLDGTTAADSSGMRHHSYHATID